MEVFRITKDEKDHILNGWHKNYAYGDCHILTTIISKELNLPIGILFDSKTDLPVHSFCDLDDGFCFDAHGVNNILYIQEVYKKSSDNLYIKRFNSIDGIKFLSLWTGVDDFYYESAIEEFKFVLDNNDNFKNNLTLNKIKIEKFYEEEYPFFKNKKKPTIF